VSTERGFTILELTVAVALSAAVILSLASTIWIVVRAERTDIGKSSFNEDFRRLERFLSGVLPVDSTASMPFSVDFSMDPIISVLSSIGGISNRHGCVDLAMITLHWSRNRELILTVDYAVNGLDLKTQQAIFPGLATFKLRCLDRDGCWVDQWSVKTHSYIPSAFHVQVEYWENGKSEEIDHTILVPAGRALS